MDAGYEEQEGQHGELPETGLGLERVEPKVFRPARPAIRSAYYHSGLLSTSDCVAGPQGLTRLSTQPERKGPPSDRHDTS